MFVVFLYGTKTTGRRLISGFLCQDPIRPEHSMTTWFVTVVADEWDNILPVFPPVLRSVSATVVALSLRTFPHPKVTEAYPRHLRIR